MTARREWCLTKTFRPQTRRCATHSRKTFLLVTNQVPVPGKKSALTYESSRAVAIANDGGPPRLSSILSLSSGRISSNGGSYRSSLPVMVYLPGIDGTGLAASRQFPFLLSCFDVVALMIPPTDRTPFNGLVDLVVEYLQQEVPRHPTTRPVYLLGESFGGLLALAIAARLPRLVDRLVLVNPATSFSQSLWPIVGPLLPQIPPQAYSVLPIALAPVLGNPVNLLGAALESALANNENESENGTRTNSQRASIFIEETVMLLTQLPLLAQLLPPDTLEWKLSLLKQGCEAVLDKLHAVEQRTLIIAGDSDLLIPSLEEADRLRKALPRAHVRIERGRSHALLQEGGVNLVRIMEKEGALVQVRRLSANEKTRNTVRFIKKPAPTDPIELPSNIEIERAAGRTTSFGRRLCSPVFLSTQNDGREQSTPCLGLGALPAQEDGPTLYVGNHQTLALDLGILCEQFIKEKGIMLRGLAHPLIFQNNTNTNSNVGGQNSFAQFLVEFGAVPVSARNLAKLLQNGESVLLFPGGVREAYKKKGEEYRLFWPDRSEFVRMAAKYGATIVPFAAVGVDDSLEILVNGEELQQVPVVGDFIRSRTAQLPRARLSEDESLVSPIAVPKFPPQRSYFLFQRPISMRIEDANDRDKCDSVYRDVKASVQEGLDYLIRRRGEDPFNDLGKRALWEATHPGKQAPTFML